MGPCAVGAVSRWGRVPVALCTVGTFERGVERSIKRSTCWVTEGGTDWMGDLSEVARVEWAERSGPSGVGRSERTEGIYTGQAERPTPSV